MLSNLGGNMEDRRAFPPDPSQTSLPMDETSISPPLLTPPDGAPPPAPHPAAPAPVSPLPPPLPAVPPLSPSAPPPSHPPLPSLLPTRPLHPRPARPRPPPPPAPRALQPAPCGPPPALSHLPPLSPVPPRSPPPSLSPPPPLSPPPSLSPPPPLSPPLRGPPSPRPQDSRLPPPLSPTPCPPLSPLLPAAPSPGSPSSPVACSVRRFSPPLLFSLSAPPQSFSSSSSSPSLVPTPSPLSPTVAPPSPSPPPPRGSEEEWAWRVGESDQERPTRALEREAAGVFVVQCRGEQVSMLSVRLPEGHGGTAVQNIPVRQYDTFLHLEGSCLLFDDIVKLVSFYCFSRDVLPVTLRLPKVITMATREELPALSAMAEEFWTPEGGDGEGGGAPAAPTRFCHILPDIVQKNRVAPSPSPAPGPAPTAPPLPQEAPPSGPAAPARGLANGDAVGTPDPQSLRFKRAPPRPPSLGGGEARREPPPLGAGDERVKVEEAGVTTTPPPPAPPPSRPPVPSQARPPPRLPPAPLRHASSRSRGAQGPAGEGRPFAQGAAGEEGEGGGEERGAVADLLQLDAGKTEGEGEAAEGKEEEGKERGGEEGGEQGPDPGPSPVSSQPPGKRPSRPVPPPRRKQAPPPPQPPGGATANQSAGVRAAPPSSARRPDVSLYSPQGGAAVAADHDSCSTSSSEGELGEAGQGEEPNHRSGEEPNHSQRSDGPARPRVKRTPTTVMLGRARNRLSSVLTGLISPDRRLSQRLVELTRDPLSYLGNLVKEHRAFTLETLSRHSSSTELLQEIRTMMTQLKIYLLQSAELQAMLEPQHQYPRDKLESIAEAALIKSVLKPLRAPIYQNLERLHTQDLQGLATSQSSVLASTSTALGVTTAVPEAPAMEKIGGKLRSLHLEYSPQRKIEMLLKTCKIIYDSMAVSSPGRAHGADDFLPVMMYVLARSNLAHLKLDVEYMMELMDPSLTLGEGSYYLTTTYGALEHIRTFDQRRAATRQLSREVQDSIHRWERRRTLNKERMAQGSVQDFLTVCCPETGSNPKALGVLPGTTVLELTEQCAARFEQDSYIISVFADGLVRPLAPTELALGVKRSLPPGGYCFVFHPAHRPPVPQTEAAAPQIVDWERPGPTADHEEALPGETLAPHEAPPEPEGESLISL